MASLFSIKEEVITGLELFLQDMPPPPPAELFLIIQFSIVGLDSKHATPPPKSELPFTMEKPDINVFKLSPLLKVTTLPFWLPSMIVDSGPSIDLTLTVLPLKFKFSKYVPGVTKTESFSLATLIAYCTEANG